MHAQTYDKSSITKYNYIRNKICKMIIRKTPQTFTANNHGTDKQMKILESNFFGRKMSYNMSYKVIFNIPLKSL